MVAPSLQFEHGIDVPKGWFDETALDFSAKLSANVTFDVPSGRVMHLNASAEFETGVDETSMGIILLNGSQSADVANDGTTALGTFVHQAAIPAGYMSGLVAKGGYQVQDTEFDKTKTYVPGDLLTAAVDNDDITVGGLLTNAGTGNAGDVEQYSDPVCGVVAFGSLVNHHGIQVLDFWPEWLPGAYVGMGN